MINVIQLFWHQFLLIFQKISGIEAFVLQIIWNINYNSQSSNNFIVHIVQLQINTNSIHKKIKKTIYKLIQTIHIYSKIQTHNLHLIKFKYSNSEKNWVHSAIQIRIDD